MWIMSLLGLVAPVVNKVFDKFLPDANEKLAAKREVLFLVEETLSKKKELIQAEIEGDHWFQKLWRPIVGWSFSMMTIFIIFCQEILRPFVYFFTGVSMPELVVPPELWYAMLFCLGGYMSLRSIEKIVRFLKF